MMTVTVYDLVRRPKIMRNDAYFQILENVDGLLIELISTIVQHQIYFDIGIGGR